MFKITLGKARESCGYNLEEVSMRLGIPIDTLNKYEVDSAFMPMDSIAKILTLYKTSSSIIFFGTEADCIKHNQE